MRLNKFVATGCLWGVALALCLPSHATDLWTVHSVRAASSFAQAGPPANDPDDTPAVAPDTSACNAGGDSSGPFDDSVPADIPELRNRVTDLTGHLSAECIAGISNHIRLLENEKGAQLRVLLVGSTGDESIEDYASRVFHTWKLGRKGVDDGVLLVAALHDHHDRIEVGFGLEGKITDAVAGDLLRSDVQPQFAAGNYGAGVSAAVDDLAHLIRGEALPKPAPKGKWMRWQLMVAALLLVCLGGIIAIRAKLRWFWILGMPFLIVAMIDIVGLAFHLESDWTGALYTLPFAVVAYLAGIFFGFFPKSGLLWLACTTGTFVAIVIAIRIYVHSVEPGRMLFYEIEAGMGSLVLGTIVFMMTSQNPLIGRHSFSSGSSSGTDSGSSSSSSDSSSGGGGDSGGGGASGSW